MNMLSMFGMPISGCSADACGSKVLEHQKSFNKDMSKFLDDVKEKK